MNAVESLILNKGFTKLAREKSSALFASTSGMLGAVEARDLLREYGLRPEEVAKQAPSVVGAGFRGMGRDALYGLGGAALGGLATAGGLAAMGDDTWWEGDNDWGIPSAVLPILTGAAAGAGLGGAASMSHAYKSEVDKAKNILAARGVKVD